MPSKKHSATSDTGIQHQTGSAPIAANSMQPLGYSVAEFALASGIGRSKLYEAILEGRLVARKFGRRTIILREDGQIFLKSLPPVRDPL